MLGARGDAKSLVPGRTKFTCTGVMCVNFSASSVCKMLGLSWTGRLSHVPSVVLSMLETSRGGPSFSSRLVTRAHAPHSTHAGLLGDGAPDLNRRVGTQTPWRRWFRVRRRSRGGSYDYVHFIHCISGQTNLCLDSRKTRNKQYKCNLVMQ